MSNLIPLLARVLLASIFLKSGIDKIIDPAGTTAYMDSKGLPFTGVLLVITIVVELVAGLSVFFGYKARWGAMALVIFLIPTTLIFHTNFADRLQTIMFMKNLAILGGLLMVTRYGSGPISLEQNS